MTSEERVLAEFSFHRPDRIPVYDKFWKYPEAWQRRLGPAERLSDISRIIPCEGAFYSRARILKREGGWIHEVDEWGRTIRRRTDAYFSETIEVPLGPGVNIDSVEFDSPSDDARYYGSDSQEIFEQNLRKDRQSHYVYVKTGGPYLRSTFVRGETQFLMDMVSDPGLARAIADKVGDHITTVGVEALRRSGLHGNGIWIYDDMAGNTGPMFSPAAFEKLLLPAFRRMIKAYKQAGAAYVLLHSDGDIRPILDMLVDAGIDGINPLERRAGMRMGAIRAAYPRLILTGGMCNTDTLVKGPISRIEAEAREIIDLGRNGGVVIGTHSISPEIPLEHFVAYREVCRTYGDFTANEME